MSSSQIIMWMIVCCLGLIVLLTFGKPSRVLFRTAKAAAIGGVSLAVVNAVLAPFGIFVGINAVTLLVVGFLGVPGVLLLYASSLML